MLVLKSFTIKSWRRLSSRHHVGGYIETQPNTVTFKYFPDHDQEEVAKTLLRVEGLDDRLAKYIPTIAKTIKAGIEKHSDKLGRANVIVSADIYAGQYGLDIDLTSGEELKFAITIQYATN